MNPYSDSGGRSTGFSHSASSRVSRPVQAALYEVEGVGHGPEAGALSRGAALHVGDVRLQGVVNVLPRVRSPGLGKNQAVHEFAEGGAMTGSLQVVVQGVAPEVVVQVVPEASEQRVQLGGREEAAEHEDVGLLRRFWAPSRPVAACSSRSRAASSAISRWSTGSWDGFRQARTAGRAQPRISASVTANRRAPAPPDAPPAPATTRPWAPGRWASAPRTTTTGRAPSYRSHREAWTRRRGRPCRAASSTARSTAARLESDPSTPTTGGSSTALTAFFSRQPRWSREYRRTACPAPRHATGSRPVRRSGRFASRRVTVMLEASAEPGAPGRLPRTETCASGCGPTWPRRKAQPQRR